MGHHIFYIGYIESEKSKNTHFVSPAGSMKMKYVAELVSRSCKQLDIISMARPVGDTFELCKSEVVRESPYINIHFSPFIKTNNLIVRKICAVFQQFRLFVFFLLNLKESDSVILYHSLAYAFLFYTLRKFKHFNFILEVEEIYKDVKKIYGINAYAENKLFEAADAFIFPTEMLDDKVNLKKKKSIIIYGNYHLPEIVRGKINDDKIHVIYSGTFDQRKGGAFTAIEVSRYLDFRYHVHITGYGTDNEIASVVSVVESLSKETSCTLTYDGYIGDREFLPYLQQFHIGLCTQNPDDVLSSSCFPSKILLYMSNGLAVLSSKAPAVMRSKIADSVFFYEYNSPSCIASTIKKIKIGKDNRELVKSLDVQCKEKMKIFLYETIVDTCNF